MCFSGRRVLGLLGFLSCLSAAEVLAEPFAYITNQKGNSVSVIDTADDHLVTTLPLKPGAEPAGVVVSRDGSKVLISNPSGKSLSFIDGRTHTLMADIPAGSSPLGIAMDAKGEYAYVADWFERTVLVLELARLKWVGRIDVGHIPAGIVVSADGSKAYVANRDDDAVGELDLHTRLQTRTVTVGKHPFGVILDPSGRYLFSANVESNDVSVVDLASFHKLRDIPVGDRPYALAVAQNRLFVTNQYESSVSVIELSDLTAASRKVPVGEYPEGIASHLDGKRVYVANWFSNSVTVIDAESLKPLHNIATGNGSRAFGQFIGGSP
jgi:YVTN family beta-propeller protein